MHTLLTSGRHPQQQALSASDHASCDAHDAPYDDANDPGFLCPYACVHADANDHDDADAYACACALPNDQPSDPPYGHASLCGVPCANDRVLHDAYACCYVYDDDGDDVNDDDDSSCISCDVLQLFQDQRRLQAGDLVDCLR